MVRYLPFAFISLILYVLFFYHQQTRDLLPASQISAPQKNIAFTLNETGPIDADSITLAGSESAIITPSTDTQIELFKTLLATINLTPASDAALLKGEIHERYFHLDFPLPPARKKQPQKAATTATKKVTKSVKRAKPTRSFKSNSATTTQQGLQNAIAVSGNTPAYPQHAKKDKLQGTVTAKFTVNMQGKTKNPHIVISSGHQILDDALLEFIHQERFMPALQGVEKVTSEQQLSSQYKFN